MRRLVNHEAIDSVEQFLVGGGLQRRRRPPPGRGSSGHRFGCGDVLAIDMGHRSRFTIVGVVAVLRLINSGPLRPHRAHGHFVELLYFHAVGDEGASDFVRFAIVAHAAFMERIFQLAVVFVGDQVRDGLAEVPEKTVAGCASFRQCGRPAPAATASDRSRAAF